MKNKIKLYTELKIAIKIKKQFNKQPNNLYKIENNRQNKTKTKPAT